MPDWYTVQAPAALENCKLLMPDGYTAQASATLENCKLVIRTPDPNRPNQSEYYFQLTAPLRDPSTSGGPHGNRSPRATWENT